MKRVMTHVWLGLAGLLLAAAPLTAADAASFPERPVTLIVPYAPGGATDIVGRLFAAKAGDELGERVVVENRTGAGGNIGMAAALHATPDGYTIVTAGTTQVIAPYLRKVPYDIFEDLTPVALVADAPEVFVVPTSLKVNNLAEFIKAAKASKTGFNFGSPGVGSPPHLAAVMLSQATGSKLVHVPFRGVADAMKELAQGNVQLAVATQASAASFAHSGLVKIIAVAAPHRLASLPDVQTTTEAGYPSLQFSNWFGIMAAKGTPKDVVDKLNAAFNRAAKNLDVENALSKQGIEPVAISPEAFEKRLHADANMYKTVIDKAGLQIK